ncbi:MAG: right-handed parallel beta-helix repeat-containing protein [Kiritimatiellae bacterium]|nr:right-handed parallel beta-helix repeat-containing protein [Kiritimatiellia bacterium]
MGSDAFAILDRLVCRLSLLCAIAGPCPALAATYYIAGTGDDGDTGLSPSNAWRTIEQVNAQGGDGHTFLFNRGDVFRGELVAAGSNITYGAYGTGEQPVIKGSVVVTNWTWNATHGCYVADETNRLRHLFVDGELMRIARYPNVDAPDLGWLKVDSGSSKSTFTDEALGDYGKPDGYWTGATLRIRSVSWLFEIRTVTDYTSNGTVTLDVDLTDTGGTTIQPGWGYYLDGKLEELDQTNEWYHDTVSNKVYLLPPGGADPNGLLVEGMSREHGLYMDWEKLDMAVEDLAFEHQVGAAIETVFVDGVVIRNCSFRKCEEIGVLLGFTSRNVVIENCLFEDNLNHAFEQITAGTNGPGTTIFQSNTIYRTGLVAGYGRTGCQEISAIRLIGTGITVRRNIIEDVGYEGIVVSGGNHVCEENIIRRAQLLLDDGGVIDVNSHSNVIRRNLIFDNWGNRDISNGTVHGGYVLGRMGFCIFMQPNLCDNVIEENTLANNTGGILLDATSHTVLRSNVVYNTTSDSMPQHLNFLAETTPNGVDDQITDNILCSLSTTQLCIAISTNYDSALFDRNVYFNPYAADVVREGWEGDPYYTLDEWRAKYPARDPNAKTNLVSFPGDAVTGVPTQDVVLFVNTNETTETVSLNGNVYADLDGNQVTGSVELGPFRSTVLVLKAQAGADLDGDEMHDAWELTYFLATNAVNGEATNDFDADGMSNLHEFLAGYDPTNAASLLEITAFDPASDTNVVLEWPSVSGKVYTVGHTAELTNSWTALQSGVTAAPPSNVWTTQLDGTRQYYRIELE